MSFLSEIRKVIFIEMQHWFEINWFITWKKTTMQKFKVIPTNIFSLTGIQIFSFFSTQMQQKYITKWGNFDNFLSENGVNFVLKWKSNSNNTSVNTWT